VKQEMPQAVRARHKGAARASATRCCVINGDFTHNGSEAAAV